MIARNKFALVMATAAFMLIGLTEPGRAVYSRFAGSISATQITNSGTLSQTGNATFAGSVKFTASQSTTTYIPAASAWPNATGVLAGCVAGSTTPYTPFGSVVFVSFNGHGPTPGSGFWAATGFLYSNATTAFYPPGANKDRALASDGNSGGSAMVKNLSFSKIEVPVTPGTAYNFCLTATQNSVSGTLCPATGINGIGSLCSFTVSER